MKFKIFIMLICIVQFGCEGKDIGEVVIYTSLDQIFSEPILSEYEKITGIKVKVIYDVEASKTTGLVNRLIAEKANPKCDVFWNSEIGKTIVLKQKNILIPYKSPSAKNIPGLFKDPENYWTGFAARARVLIYNTNLIKPENLPKSIFELTGPKWKERVALAYPLFGTTATHVAALFVHMGEKKAKLYLKNLKNNNIQIVNGNSVARDVVVEGRYPIAFTDTDDANVAIQSGKPVNMIYPDIDGIGTLLIPNTVALIKNSPNPQQGKKLIDYLLSEEVESKLAHCKSAQMPLRNGVKKPKHVPEYSKIKAMDIDYYKVAEMMERSSLYCQDLFVR